MIIKSELKFFGILTLFFVVKTVGQDLNNGCLLPIEVENEEHMPVLLDNSTSKYKLIIPHNGKIQMDKGEKITLLCPNLRNTLELTHTNSTLATCVSGEKLHVLKYSKNFENISCTHGVRGEAQDTNEICGGGQGRIIKLGFPARDKFLTLIEVCYDSSNGNALYASNLLIGKEIQYASSSTFRPAFSTAKLGPGVAANIAYKKAYQKATFNKLLGSAALAEKYINDKSFLARGHLAPDADFLFASWQFATYFYVNTVPQWQSVNNGNWKQLEMLLRSTAELNQKDYMVYTGSHKVLSLANVRKAPTKIYLVSGKKLAVPNFVYKILYSEKSKEAIAFVLLNNPFKDNLGPSDKLCKNICERYGWDNYSWTNVTRGFIYCCDARDLLKVVPTGPELIVKGILRGPEKSSRVIEFEELIQIL